MQMKDNQNPSRGLGTFALILLISGAIDSIRNLPATALSGSALVFFFLFSAAVFLVPVALVSARLASAFPKQGGVYQWVRAGLGEKTAFLAVWLQWINTMVWFPTILSFIAATAAWLIDPALAAHRAYLISFILVLFWTLTLLNLRGIRTSAWFANICALFGLLIPMGLIILFAGIWIFSGKPLQIHFTASSLLPSLTHSSNWIALTAIMTAFLGMELATVHIRDVANPQRTFPRALLCSVLLILTTMILGSLALAIVLPAKEISLVGGVMQAFSYFLNAFHLKGLVPVLTLMLLTGSVGGMTSWLISPARGLLQAAEHGFLPEWFVRKNRFGVANRLLLTQAVIVTVLCLGFLLMPSVNGSYWLLSALSTQLYVLMYILMFVSAIRLEKKIPQNAANVFTLIGGSLGTRLVCILGLAGCLMTIAVGFIPPEGINVGTTLHYEQVFCCGMLLMVLPVGFFFTYRWRKQAGATLPASLAHNPSSSA